MRSLALLLLFLRLTTAFHGAFHSHPRISWRSKCRSSKCRSSMVLTAATSPGPPTPIDDERDLEEAASLCVQVFFGSGTSVPWKALQLRTLYKEQLADLAAKFRRDNCTLFKIEHEGTMVGFVEVSISTGFRSIGPEIPIQERRPLLSNLAVLPAWRRRKLGAELVKTCERCAAAMGFHELILQVEEDNEAGRAFYASQVLAQILVS